MVSKNHKIPKSCPCVLECHGCKFSPTSRTPSVHLYCKKKQEVEASIVLQPLACTKKVPLYPSGRSRVCKLCTVLFTLQNKLKKSSPVGADCPVALVSQEREAWCPIPQVVIQLLMPSEVARGKGKTLVDRDH